MLAAAATTSAAALRAPAVASRRAASGAARAAPRRAARCQAGPEAGPGHVEYGAPGASDAIATRSDLAAERNPSSMRRAREILAIDPTAENALDLVGTKVNMTCRFSVHYETTLGEDLFVIGSHEKLGAWRIEAATGTKKKRKLRFAAARHAHGS